MTERQIYFHIGLPKTGSSALQEFLSLNAKELDQHGISYPFPEGKDTVEVGKCTGNIMHRLQRRAAKEGSIIAPGKLLDPKYLAPVVQEGLAATNHPKVVFSSETLSTHLSETLVDFFNDLSKENSVILVAYVRDAYDQIISGWKQRVKTAAAHDNLEDYVDMRIRAGTFPIAHIMHYVSVNLDMHVLNYDAHRKDIFSPFLNILDSNLSVSKLQPVARGRSNPSQTFAQTRLIVMATQLIQSPLLSATMAKHFLAQNDRTPDPYLREVDRLVLDHLREPILHINEHLPREEKLRCELRDYDDTGEDMFTKADISSMMAAVKELLELEKSRPPLRRRKGLPTDFDSLAYLMLNPDVEAAGLDPVSHFLNHGRYEGRRYK